MRQGSRGVSKALDDTSVIVNDLIVMVRVFQCMPCIKIEAPTRNVETLT